MERLQLFHWTRGHIRRTTNDWLLNKSRGDDGMLLDLDICRANNLHPNCKIRQLRPQSRFILARREKRKRLDIGHWISDGTNNNNSVKTQ